MLARDGVDCIERDVNGESVTIDGRARVKDLRLLIEMTLAGESFSAIRRNLDYFIRLRNLVAHRYLPELDPLVTGHAQSMLLNTEKLLVDQFGNDAKLGDRLAVPLQLSGFRNVDALQSLKAAQNSLPPDVMNFLTSHRDEAPTEVLRSPEY